jgi:hypothetical protein
MMRQRAYVPMILVLALLGATSAHAHHEAMFGPQSAAVLSPGIFLSAQIFDKETGKNDQKRRETTTVFSVGLTPLKKQPLSISTHFGMEPGCYRKFMSIGVEACDTLAVLITSAAHVGGLLM